MANLSAKREQDGHAAAEFGRPSIRRRQLLKSAATGPLLATLPSGAALANASFAECAVKQQTALPDERPPGITHAPDSHLRVMGYTKRYRLANGFEVTVYEIPKTNTGLSHDVTIYGDPPSGARLPPGTHVGDWFDESTAGAVALRENPQETAFLYLYGVEDRRASGAGVSVAADTGTPRGCSIAGPLDNWPIDPRAEGPYNHCFYPIAVQNDLGPMENMPLTHSCMCSMLPKHTACAVL